ncbi:MAG TPA: helix-turn-helix transcriptional regulator [Thermomicrobiales bacterium]|nr:helix-turn-helix transcriptional regulator [Thermomicrobiales bacterium]
MHDALLARLDAAMAEIRAIRQDLDAITPRARFPDHVRAERQGRRWSQERLAEEAGIDHSLISRLEAGVRQPTRGAVTRLADAFALTGARRTRFFAAAGYLEEMP